MTVKQETTDAALPASPDRKAAQARTKARADAVKRHTDIRRAVAWPVHRVPLEKHPAARYVARGRAKLVLPRAYRMGGGADRAVVRPHDDLNALVFQWYDERVVAHGGVNFVAKDGVIASRHEYLGPDPRVAGYQLSADGEIHIRWWDAFLQDPWVGNAKWSVDVVCDAQGEWVENEQ